MTIKFCNFRSLAPEGANVINVTSRSKTWSKGLSPFVLGPVPLWGDFEAKNVENAWQFSKVYEAYDDNGEPNEHWLKWAISGWTDGYAHRYPEGRGAKPLYSWWNGQKLDYLEARKQIYIPLYSYAVLRSSAYRKLTEAYIESETSGQDLYIWDFDVYDKGDLTYKEVFNNPKKRAGHGFVLGMLLEEENYE